MMKILRIFCLLVALVMFGFFFLLGPRPKKVEAIKKKENLSSTEIHKKIDPKIKTSYKKLLPENAKGKGQVEKVRKVKDNLRMFMGKMNKRASECEEGHRKFFKTGREFDDFQNKNPDQLISDMDNLFSETLYRTEQVDYYNEIKSLVKSDIQFDPVSAYKFIKDNRICRDGKSLGAIGFILNLSQNRSWKKKQKLHLAAVILTGVKTVLGTEYTSENLSFSIGKLGSLNNLGYLKRTSTEDLKGLVRKITEQHKNFRKGFSESRSDRERLNSVLKDHLYQNELIGEEIKDFIDNELIEFKLLLGQ